MCDVVHTQMVLLGPVPTTHSEVAWLHFQRSTHQRRPQRASLTFTSTDDVRLSRGSGFQVRFGPPRENSIQRRLWKVW